MRSARHRWHSLIPLGLLVLLLVWLAIAWRVMVPH